MAYNITLEDRPSAIIEPSSDGSFQHIEIDPEDDIPEGMFEALLLPARDAEDRIIDIVAWEIGRENPWWRLKRFADVLGYGAIASCQWPKAGPEELRLYATPRRWLKAIAPNAVCILDWKAPLEIVFSGVTVPIVCESKLLQDRFAARLLEQRSAGLASLLRV